MEHSSSEPMRARPTGPRPAPIDPAPPADADGPGGRRFPCAKCGAKLEFVPGASVLKCPYCSHENAVDAGDAPIEELDFEAMMARLESAAPKESAAVAKCQTCGAEVSVPAHITSFSCSFCGSNVVNQSRGCDVIRPLSLLPFKVTREQAVGSFRAWVKSRWFAPSALKSRATLDNPINGIYIPAWTFDSHVTTRYTGQRGEHYYETEWVTVNGQRQMRQVRKTRWYPASGTVFNRFDDLLVKATTSLPPKKLADLEPWDLASLVPYRDDYLAGFSAERYTIGPREGFALAEQAMLPVIRSTICHDIGGDEQTISWMDSRHANVRFKHLLLPVWISAYRFSGKVYQFMVNARTGEVQGERPYSAIKIALAVLAAIIAIAVIVVIAQKR